MTIFPWVTTDCLGYTQLFGLLTGLSENTVDVVTAGHLFGIASVYTTQHVSISSIILLSCFNCSHCYSYIDRLIGDCKSKFINEMYGMIYGIKSHQELNTKFIECLIACGHHQPAKKFIQTLFELKTKLCRAHSQFLFSFLRTSMQRSESFNDRIKGHSDLNEMLADADLVTLHMYPMSLSLWNDNKALTEFIKLCKSEKRWSNSFVKYVQNSLECAIKIQTCENIDLLGMMELCLTFAPKLFIEELSTQFQLVIVGIGARHFRIALTENNRPVLSIENIHPFHLIRLHPLWTQALSKCH
eukprot:CCRYP_009558-RA/>CCRYP_009558-RA protein AED:0.23 eAED:0.33 QI:0/0/0/1/0/0/4/0/299